MLLSVRAKLYVLLYLLVTLAGLLIFGLHVFPELLSMRCFKEKRHISRDGKTG